MNVTEQVGKEAAALIDHLDEKYGADNYQIGSVIVIADVVARGEGGLVNPIEYGSSDPRRWVQVALLREALDLAEEANEDRANAVAENEDD